MNLYKYCFVQFAHSYSELNVSILNHICIGLNYAVGNLNAPFVENNY
jgi:hypothetical protein